MIFNTSGDGLVHLYAESNGGTYHSGTVLWDGNSQQLKVVDGQGNSQSLYLPRLTVSASSDIHSVMNWAKKKMLEEAELERLCKEFPTLEDARREFEMLKTLVKDHNVQR